MTDYNSLIQKEIANPQFPFLYAQYQIGVCITYDDGTKEVLEGDAFREWAKDGEFPEGGRVQLMLDVDQFVADWWDEYLYLNVAVGAMFEDGGWAEDI